MVAVFLSSESSTHSWSLVYFFAYATLLSVHAPTRSFQANDLPTLVAENARTPKGEERIDVVVFPLAPTASLEAAGRKVRAIEAIVVL